MNNTNGVQDVSFGDIDWASMGGLGKLRGVSPPHIPNPNGHNIGNVTARHSGPLGTVGITIPTPPKNIPGGPYEPSGPGQRLGHFFGPKQTQGPRTDLQWVPPKPDNGFRGYWKVKFPGTEWQRYTHPEGIPESPNEAHPGFPEGDLPLILITSPATLAVGLGVVLLFAPTPAY